eukprot:TRINITY_DN9054_c0_g1_i5.p1 TRINITY_DN9054_c0_g1~~TRINITY_DN9054_c0_g1_i5.p1  ORF type:complete len:247 (-),score=-3.34 TRINITY_DN9054_c0_g1_i5:217-957(-)
MVGIPLTSSPKKPAWLKALLSDHFFVPCFKHLDLKKNEVNIFCVDCCASICQYCLPSHRSHRLLQVRRYVYHDVIRLHDIQKLLDCSLVQTYITNSARVVFLNQRPQSRLSKGFGNSCETCDRVLQEPYRYCSVRCKVDAVKNLSSVLLACSSLQLTDFLPSPSSASPKGVEETDYMEESLSSTSSGEFLAADRAATPNPNQATALFQLPKKMRSGTRWSNGVMLCSHKSVIPSRRKGYPQRSPLY